MPDNNPRQNPKVDNNPRNQNLENQNRQNDPRRTNLNDENMNQGDEQSQGLDRQNQGQGAANDRMTGARAPGTAGGGRGSNLSQEDRARGGIQSAESQQRDRHGQFAGRPRETNNDDEDAEATGTHRPQQPQQRANTGTPTRQ